MDANGLSDPYVNVFLAPGIKMVCIEALIIKFADGEVLCTKNPDSPFRLATWSISLYSLSVFHMNTY